MTNPEYALWYTLASSNHRRESFKLYKKTGNFETLYRYGLKDYIDSGEMNIEYLKRLTDKELSAARREKWLMENYNARLVCACDSEYPSELKKLRTYPVSLYVRGNVFSPNDEPCIAVVGTRNVSPEGAEFARNASYILAKSGFTVISGMAAGTDTNAHIGAIDAKGKTIAVFGCGFGTVYPSSNKNLMIEIMKNGSVCSEYNFDMPALKHNFPERNRIVSGMSRGVLVVEGETGSGSVITARLAHRQKRDLFIWKNACKTAKTKELFNSLGAIAISSPEEILNFYNTENNTLNNTPYENNTSPKSIILQSVATDAKTIDEISTETNIDINELISEIILMEIEGVITRTASGEYIAL